MLTPADIDVTLPSLIPSLRGSQRAPELVLTIIFHPDSSRIGHTAVVSKARGNAPWILGRRSPDFRGPDDSPAMALDDPHVSRMALQFAVRGTCLTIIRLPASSRCQVGPNELFDSVEVTREQLQAGVPLMLGHSVVLLLRLGHSCATSATGALLRGSSACMAAIREQVARAADSDLDVLIRGETGTGKELVATAIQRASRRAAAPMVSVNMAAIPGSRRGGSRISQAPRR